MPCTPCPLCSHDNTTNHPTSTCRGCGFAYDDDTSGYLTLDPDKLPNTESRLWTHIPIYGTSHVHNKNPDWPLFPSFIQLTDYLKNMYPTAHPILQRVVNCTKNSYYYYGTKDWGGLYVTALPYLNTTTLGNDPTLTDDELVTIAGSPVPVLLYRNDLNPNAHFRSRDVKSLNNVIETQRPAARAAGVLVYSNPHRDNLRLGLNASSLKRHRTRTLNKETKNTYANHRSTRVNHWTPTSYAKLYRLFELINTKFVHLKFIDSGYHKGNYRYHKSWDTCVLNDLQLYPQGYADYWNVGNISDVKDRQSDFARYVMNTIRTCEKHPGLLRAIHKRMGPGTLITLYAIYLDGRDQRFGYPATPRAIDSTPYAQSGLRYLNRVTTTYIDTTIPDWWRPLLPPRYTEADLLEDFPQLKPTPKRSRGKKSPPLNSSDILVDVTLTSTPAQCESDPLAPAAQTATV